MIFWINNNHDNIDFIIPPGFFDVKLPVILIEIPYRDKNEVASKHFIKNFNKFTNDKHDIRICICEETICNVEARWKEHNTSWDKSNWSQQINSQLDYIFTWSIICIAPTNKFNRKLIEAYFIVHLMIKYIT